MLQRTIYFRKLTDLIPLRLRLIAEETIMNRFGVRFMVQEYHPYRRKTAIRVGTVYSVLSAIPNLICVSATFQKHCEVLKSGIKEGVKKLSSYP